MIKLLGGAVVLAAVLGMSGCGGDGQAASTKTVTAPESAAAGDTAAVCARWKEAQLLYLLSTAPEAEAYAKAMADSYEGKQVAGALQIQHAFFSAWADAVRPLVAQADAPDLQAALRAQVDELDGRAAAGTIDFTQQPVMPGQELCLKG
jgi:hypothetical protein